MRITADTNVLVRFAVRDDPAQARVADTILDQASLIAVSTACLCEFVWVLRSAYRFADEQVHFAVEVLLKVPQVVVNRPAAEAGLAALRAGADFADGAIAYEGRRLGGDKFVSFDRKAVAALTKHGISAELLR